MRIVTQAGIEPPVGMESPFILQEDAGGSRGLVAVEDDVLWPGFVVNLLDLGIPLGIDADDQAVVQKAPVGQPVFTAVLGSACTVAGIRIAFVAVVSVIGVATAVQAKRWRPAGRFVSIVAQFD